MAIENVIAVKYVGQTDFELEYDSFPGVYKPGQVYIPKTVAHAKFLLRYKPFGKPAQFVRVEVPKEREKEAATVAAANVTQTTGTMVPVKNNAKIVVNAEWDGLPYVFQPGEVKENIPIAVAKNLCLKTVIPIGKRVDKTTKKEVTLVAKPLSILEDDDEGTYPKPGEGKGDEGGGEE